MSQPSTIDQLRNARDTALAALKFSIDAIAKKIEVATGPNEVALNQRLDNLVNQSDAIETAAVLALPEVIAAAATLNALSAQMTKTAQQLPTAANLLATTATVLALGQQFSGTLANAHHG